MKSAAARACRPLSASPAFSGRSPSSRSRIERQTMPDLDLLSRSQLLLQYLCAVETLTVDSDVSKVSSDTPIGPVPPEMTRVLATPQEI